MGSTPPNSDGTDSQAQLTPEFQQKVQLLKDRAAQLIDEVAESDRMVFLRGQRNDLGLADDVSDRDLETMLAEAESSLAPVICYETGDLLTAEDPVFLVDGLIRLGSPNILVGQPKVGKSSFVTGLIAAIRDRKATFVGNEINHPQAPMPVLIFGTDQPEADWLYFLRREGLVTEDKRIMDPLKVFCSVDGQQHFNFSRAGVRRMKEKVERHQCPLVIIDSLSSMMEPLGMDENLSQFCGPVRHALRELSSTGATIIVLHHTTKRVVSWDWVEECRGSSSISSVFSWGVLARWLTLEDEAAMRTDYRVGMVGKGRGKGNKEGVLAEYTDDGWVAHGGLERAQMLETLRQREMNLTNARAAVFDSVANHHAMGRDVSTTELASELNKTVSNVSRELRNLVSVGLLRATREEATGARPSRFYGLTLLMAELQAGGAPPVRRIDFSDSFEKESIESRNSTLGSEPAAQKESSPLEPPHPALGPSESSPPDPTAGNLEPPARGTPVERLVNGAWQNGWVVQAAPNPHWVTITKIGRSSMVLERQRWMVDIRPCAKPFPSAA